MQDWNIVFRPLILWRDSVIQYLQTILSVTVLIFNMHPDPVILDWEILHCYITQKADPSHKGRNKTRLHVFTNTEFTLTWL